MRNVFILVVVSIAPISFAYGQPLNETLERIRSAVNTPGVVKTDNTTHMRTFGFEVQGCIASWTYSWDSPDADHLTTRVSTSLASLNAAKVLAENYTNPNGKKLVVLKLNSSIGKTFRWEMHFPEGPGVDARTDVSQRDSAFLFVTADADLDGRIANALKHAILLCGGKDSPTR